MDSVWTAANRREDLRRPRHNSGAWVGGVVRVQEKGGSVHVHSGIATCAREKKEDKQDMKHF